MHASSILMRQTALRCALLPLLLLAATTVAADPISRAVSLSNASLVVEEGGRMVIPLGSSPEHGEQELVSIVKQDGKPVREEHGKCRFVPLLGKFGWAS